MKAWNAKPHRDVVERTLAALKANGIEATLAATTIDAREMVLAMIPPGRKCTP